MLDFVSFFLFPFLKAEGKFHYIPAVRINGFVYFRLEMIFMSGLKLLNASSLIRPASSLFFNSFHIFDDVRGYFPLKGWKNFINIKN